MNIRIEELRIDARRKMMSLRRRRRLGHTTRVLQGGPRGSVRTGGVEGADCSLTPREL
ncbi:hypothetical protein J6590_090352 [Homalodisca vitripennis]|nr:hypothetical protein J6590_090352 [Homalodisca vitripennis]